MPTITVWLNGTDENPWERMGLTQNPFPQLGRAETVAAELRVNKLGGPQIPKDHAEQYIRETLDGFSAEFVALCLKMYEPGELVQFTVTFPEQAPHEPHSRGLEYPRGQWSGDQT